MRWVTPELYHEASSDFANRIIIVIKEGTMAKDKNKKKDKKSKEKLETVDAQAVIAEAAAATTEASEPKPK